MLRVDLEAAGIPYETASGVADFHALRAAYITHLIYSGASVKTCQTLARHSTPSLTIGLYAKASLHDIKGAVENLPDLTPRETNPQSLAMTGTDGKFAHHYDLIMSSFNTRGAIEGGNVFFQVKATDDLPLLADRKTISWMVSRRDLGLWLNEAYPVILAVYDGRRDRAFWLHLQGYFAGYQSADLFLAGRSINIRIRGTNRLTRRSVNGMVGLKNITHAELLARDLSHD
jgi:hypothetical protein